MDPLQMCHQATKFLYNSVWSFLCCLAGRQKNEQINRWLCKQSFTTTFGLAKEPKKGDFFRHKCVVFTVFWQVEQAAQSQA